MKKYKNLLLGITGSANLLKLPDYLAELSDIFEHVRIIPSPDVTTIINKNMLTMFVERIYASHVETNLSDYNHIKLANWADVFIIVPATANVIGKIANGIADDFLTTTALSYGHDLIICPNMNKDMWKNPILQENVKKLKKFNYKFIGPSLETAYTVATNKQSKQYVVPTIESFGQQLEAILFQEG